MFCKACGTSLKEGAKFCGKCGAKVMVPIPSASSSNVLLRVGAEDGSNIKRERPTPRASSSDKGMGKSRKPLILGGGLLLIAALAAASVWFYLNQDTPTADVVSAEQDQVATPSAPVLPPPSPYLGKVIAEGEKMDQYHLNQRGEQAGLKVFVASDENGYAHRVLVTDTDNKVLDVKEVTVPEQMLSKSGLACGLNKKSYPGYFVLAPYNKSASPAVMWKLESQGTLVETPPPPGLECGMYEGFDNGDEEELLNEEKPALKPVSQPPSMTKPPVRQSGATSSMPPSRQVPEESTGPSPEPVKNEPSHPPAQPMENPKQQEAKPFGSLFDKLKNLEVRPANSGDQEGKSCPIPGQSC